MSSEDATERIGIARHHDGTDFRVSLSGHLFALVISSAPGCFLRPRGLRMYPRTRMRKTLYSFRFHFTCRKNVE